MIHRPLSPEDEAELERLNAAVTAALDARTAWLDRKMAEYATIPIGGEIWDVKRGVRLGVVTEHYRYRSSPLSDKSLNIDYRYLREGTPNSYDNTSSQPECRFGTADDARRHAEAQLQRVVERTHPSARR